jgi:F-type H+-transporting ATPase subunit gamma
VASTIVLKRRITSIKGTRQITKALQLVSASKLRRAQEFAMRSRAYSDLAYELLAKLSAIEEIEQQPLFKRRPVARRLYIVITNNSGLAGAYNANVLKLLARGAQDDATHNVKTKVIVIGNKGAQFARRLRGVELLAVYSDFGDNPTATDIRPILTTLMEQYESEAVDEVCLLSTVFESTLRQVAQSSQLLPATKQVTDDPVDSPAATTVTNFEPDVETVILQITTRLIEAQLWQALLESLASFHAMRMLAMKNATDNAKDLIDDYTLELNTARQASITQELAEITGGAEALNG